MSIGLDAIRALDGQMDGRTALVKLKQYRPRHAVHALHADAR